MKNLLIASKIIFILVASALLLAPAAFLNRIVFPPTPYSISHSAFSKEYHVDLYSTFVELNSDYIDLAQLIKTMPKGNKIIFHMHNYGGSVEALSLLVNAVESTKAETTAYVDAPSYSAGAVFSCATNNLVMEPNSFIMFHGMAADGEMVKEAGLIGYSKKLLTQCVEKGILREEDIYNINNGKEVYVSQKVNNNKITYTSVTNDDPRIIKITVPDVTPVLPSNLPIPIPTP